MLENVTIRIDARGNFYIEAPHYEVSEEGNYQPLSSSYAPGTTPKHATSGPLPSNVAPAKSLKKIPPPYVEENPSLGLQQNKEMKSQPLQLRAKEGSKSN